MREWDGIRDDQTSVGSQALMTATGVAWQVAGELQRRAGLTYLTPYGGVMLATFRSPVTGAWIIIAQSNGTLRAVKLSDGSTVSLLTGYNVAVPPNWSILGPRIYFCNDFDRIKVWDGVWSAARDAGIAAPAAAPGGPNSTAAGTSTAGTHYFRYRYVDSLSPGGVYRSNPSTAVAIVIAGGAERLTFTVGGGSNIVPSSDPKVDTIILEVTTVDDASVYYQAVTIANTASSAVFNMSDTILAVQTLSATYDDFGHEQPPLARAMFECRGFTFLCGFIARTVTCDVVATSTTVAGTGFSTLWAGRLIRFGTDNAVYSIASVASSSSLTLATAYAGSTATGVSAIVYSQTPNRAYWSKNGYPESYKALTRAKDVLSGNGDRVVGGADFMGDAWFFGQRSMSRLVFVEDPAVSEVVPIPGYHGLWNQRCLIGVDGLLYGWGPNGAWTLTGGRARWISKSIDDTVAALLDRTKMDQAHAQYDPVAKTIRWAFVMSGESTPRYAMKMDLEKQRWSIDQYRMGIDSSVVVADDNGRLRLAVSDSTNSQSYFHDGATDGVPATSTGSYTGNSGSTTTVVQVNEALPTGTGTDLSKLILYRPSTGEERVISSNTGSAMTVSVALGTAPSSGELLYVGQIPFTVATDWWLGEDMAAKKQCHLHLLLRPGTAGTARVKVYRDFSASPHVWTQNSDDTWPDGVTLTSGNNYMVVDLTTGTNVTDGFVALPMPSEWSRALRAEVSVIDPVGVPAILDIRFAVEGKRDSQMEMRE